MPTVNLRTFLWLLLAAALFLNLTQWQRDYPAASPPPPSAAAPTAPLDSAPTPAPAAPGASAAKPADSASVVAPAAGAPAGAPAGASAGAATGASDTLANATAGAAAVAAAGKVRVVTDVLDVDISLAGGELSRADLPRYPLQKDQPDVPVRLLNRDSADSLYVLQSGLEGAGGASAPTHQAMYTAQVSDVRLQSGQDEVSVPLTWTDGHGVTVTKTFTFHRGEYVIGMVYRVVNDGDTAWSFAPYTQILRNNPPVESSMFHVETYSFKGPAFYDGNKYAKVNFNKGATLDQNVTGGWIAALQYHFVAAAVPASDAAYHFQLRKQGTEFLLSALGPSQSAAPKATVTVAETLFVGPKLQKQLDLAGPNLDLVTDYGSLRILAQPLFWLLDHVHTLIGNWGFTIILVTILLKMLFYPLSEASGRSMAKMKGLQPRMAHLRETYQDDREKLNRAMMELYQREKINPLAGCLPMLIQFPVLLAFYWVLRDSVEMRQAPFIFWIHDLSSRDPYFILPALMAAANFLQFKLNPQMGDPAQQKVMMFMPIVMSVMFAFFPAGLVLYWVTNTVLSIAQQWHINKRIAQSAAKARS
jgi:YidC/Oxa1 family membrane protein insertase